MIYPKPQIPQQFGALKALPFVIDPVYEKFEKKKTVFQKRGNSVDINLGRKVLKSRFPNT